VGGAVVGVAAVGGLGYGAFEAVQQVGSSAGSAASSVAGADELADLGGPEDGDIQE
jgi:hypothetical protein